MRGIAASARTGVVWGLFAFGAGALGESVRGAQQALLEAGFRGRTVACRATREPARQGERAIIARMNSLLPVPVTDGSGDLAR
ncbi:hypothetical protein BFR47_07685 [Oceanisphaera psychrotolerans]|uniref:Uncharacterized protein n=1 Tax=Oceanisphaera psychrotolerans TaxID=1414654 RepID=A0A1J4QHB1_9GAMM|nr:hypothetical protein BFR47_07685 [Oceanisphaera psychrotolerans]